MGKKKEDPIRFVFQSKNTDEEYVDEEVLAARKKREAYARREALIEKKKRKAKEKKNKSKEQVSEQSHKSPAKSPPEHSTKEIARLEVKRTQIAKPGPPLSNKAEGLRRKPLEDIVEEVRTPARSTKHVPANRPSTIASSQASIRTRLPELSERVVSSAKSSTQTHDKAPLKPEPPPPVKRKGTARFGGIGRTFTSLFSKKKKKEGEIKQNKTKVLPPISKATTPEDIKLDEEQSHAKTVKKSNIIATPPLPPPPPPKITCEIGIQTSNPPQLKRKSRKTKAPKSVPPDHEEEKVPSTKSSSVVGTESSMSIQSFGESPLPPIESTANSNLSKSPESQAEESLSDSKIETSPEVDKEDKLSETSRDQEDSPDQVLSNFMDQTSTLAPHTFYTKQDRSRGAPSRSGNLSRQFKIEDLKEILQQNRDIKNVLNGEVLLPLGTRHTESCPPGHVAETLDQQVEQEQLDGEEFNDFDNDDDFYADVKKKWKIWREMRKKKRDKKETEGYYKLLNLIYRGYDSDEELDFKDFKSKYDINVDVEFQELKNNNADEYSPDKDENKLVRLVNKLERDNYELSRKIKRRENQFPFSEKRLGVIKDQVEHEKAEKLLRERSKKWGDSDVPIVTYKERKMLERQEKKVKYTDDLMNYVKEFGIAVDPNNGLPNIDSSNPSTPGLGETADVEPMKKKTKEYKLKKNAAQALFDAENDLKDAEKVMWNDIKTEFKY